jgi:hypothetical protein
MVPKRTIASVTALALVLLASPVAARQPLTPDAAVATIEAAAGRQPWIETMTIGSTIEGRSLVAAHLDRRSTDDPWTVLLIGQQHGDEPAGMEALVALIDEASQSPSVLPEDIDLWIVPMANPDGAAADSRRNGADADLNRDHVLLEQPETRALHELARTVRPHVTVDCHEFRRDSSDYLERGWTEWPLITMDTANHPLLPDATYTVGLQWIERAGQRLADHGYRYRRYLVGDAPPDGERRPSTFDGDDARNGLALGGSVSFIIESGIHRTADDPHADLDRRVAAYRALLDVVISDTHLREATRAVVRAMRSAPPPETIPTNVFWGARDLDIVPFRVVERETGTTAYVPTQVMDTRVFKSGVPAPEAYALLPETAAAYVTLLERHGLRWVALDTPREVTAEACTLERVEDAYDPTYHRYSGRQVVQRGAAARTTLPAGTVLVPIDQPGAVRVATVLEPCQLFGLYQHQQFRATVTADGEIPVLRVMPDAPTDM